jgi:hypothetical protein
MIRVLRTVSYRYTKDEWLLLHMDNIRFLHVGLDRKDKECNQRTKIWEEIFLEGLLNINISLILKWDFDLFVLHYVIFEFLYFQSIFHCVYWNFFWYKNPLVCNYINSMDSHRINPTKEWLLFGINSKKMTLSKKCHICN